MESVLTVFVWTPASFFRLVAMMFFFNKQVSRRGFVELVQDLL